MAKTITQLPDATVVNAADELIIQQSGVTKRATKTELLSGIVNANIDAAAAIAFSKLAALDSANILVGNGSNVATKVAVTGDVTISNAGVTAIGDNKVVTAKILDANVTPAKLSQPFTLATSQASTSGTSIDFTGIPSWAKRITVMFDGVSTNGTTRVQVQLGDAGGVEATNYFSTVIQTTEGVATSGTSPFSTGFPINYGTTGANRTGALVINLMSGNKWVAHGILNDTGNSNISLTVGLKGLSDTLTQVRITTVNGTDTFDAGAINISYEG
jgi:hypothetical protein